MSKTPIHFGTIYKLRFRRTLLFYPNGDSAESNSHVSLFLNLVSSVSTNFVAKFTLGVLAQAGYEPHMGYKLMMSGDEFKSIPGFGQDKLITFDKLFDAKNHLVTHCEMTLVCEVLRRLLCCCMIKHCSH